MAVNLQLNTPTAGNTTFTFSFAQSNAIMLSILTNVAHSQYDNGGVTIDGVTKENLTTAQKASLLGKFIAKMVQQEAVNYKIVQDRQAAFEAARTETDTYIIN
jgi:hypothetical protein